jgi:hypothetical protein
MSGGRVAGIALAVALAAATARGADPCATPAGSVSGVVMAMGGGPIAGALVRVQGCLGDPVVTDAGGGFTVTVPAGPVVIAAAAAGHYNGCYQPTGSGNCGTSTAGDAGLAIALEPLPTDDDPAYAFRSPGACQVCHGELYDQWSRATMSHTNQNRWVDNLYNGTDLGMPPGPPPDPQNPPYFGFLSRHNVDASHPTRNGECANCHQPEYVGLDPSNTSFNAFSRPPNVGVACDFCHKIVDVDVSPAGIARPNLVVGQLGLPAKTTMLRSTSQPWLAFGPLDDVTFPGGSEMRASHAPIIRESRLCAACHEDNADRRDENGDFLGTYDGVASQLTYSEWAASPYPAQGIQCQDCHMPPSGAEKFCSRTSNVRDPSQVRAHTFEGTTPEFLQRAVKLRTRVSADGDTLGVSAAVSNVGAGHHVPTGVTLRNMILVVAARGRDGTALQRVSGPTVPNWGGVGPVEAGNFAGLAGKGFARVLVDEFLAENVLFTEAVNAFDNRIPAGQTDTSSYTFRLPDGRARRDVRVETSLYYRRAFKPIADQRKWNVPLGGNAHGTRGDGSDYDENLVVAHTIRFLSCKGRVGGFSGTGSVSGGTLALSGTVKLPRGVGLDPVAEGVDVTLGEGKDRGTLLDEQVNGFVADGKTVRHQGAAGDAVQGLDVAPQGRRAFRVTVTLGGLAPDVLARRVFLFGLDGAEVCFLRPLRCKAKGDALRCR